MRPGRSQWKAYAEDDLQNAMACDLRGLRAKWMRTQSRAARIAALYYPL